MIGQGLLRECLLDPGVDRVLSIGRSVTGQQHPKLRELVRSDLYDYSDIEADLTGYDACFFCLGTSAAGKSEDEYRRITYDLTMAAATTPVLTTAGSFRNIRTPRAVPTRRRFPEPGFVSEADALVRSSP